MIVAVLEELLQRGGLQLALRDRSDTALEPLLVFLTKHIANPRWSRFLIQLAHTVLDLYAEGLGRIVLLDELVLKLRRKVDEEVVFGRQLLSVQGMLMALVNAAGSAGVIPDATGVDMELGEREEARGGVRGGDQEDQEDEAEQSLDSDED